MTTATMQRTIIISAGGEVLTSVVETVSNWMAGRSGISRADVERSRDVSPDRHAGKVLSNVGSLTVAQSIADAVEGHTIIVRLERVQRRAPEGVHYISPPGMLSVGTKVRLFRDLEATWRAINKAADGEHRTKHR